jgi:FkbM family methyltransferase
MVLAEPLLYAAAPPMPRLLRPLARAATAAARAYIRYAPTHPGKHWVWEHVFTEHFAWRGYQGHARTRWGGVFKVDCQDMIQRAIFHYGVWEPNLTVWMRRRLQPGDGFLDVGANIGYFSVMASELVGPRGCVVAVEPSPSTLALLRENLRMSGAERVRVLAMAASDQRGELALQQAASINIGMTETLDAASHAHLPKVPAMPLAEVLTSVEVERLRLIKIDTEGAELLALRGLMPLVEKLRHDCEWVVEVSPQRLQERGYSAQALIEMMTSRGYHAYRLENDYRPEAYFDMRAVPPMRLRGVPHEDTDVVFSRVDSETL